ncbi:MAG: hypothetical protein M3R62_13475 [Acidobacteriota bacterium]|nr:hypothetical protein [Acidobacteriota bacterium]
MILAYAAVSLASSRVVLAHGAATLSERGYQEMQQLAHELDVEAQHARDQAQHKGVWFYGHDPRFTRSVSNFARRASQFHERMDNYRTAPWQVDEELRALLRDARAVQYRLTHSRYTDEHTVSDWNRTVDLLNQMIRVFQNDVSRNQNEDRNGNLPGYYPDTRDSRSRDPYEAGSGAGYARQRTDDVAALAHELADRSARLADATSQLSGRYQDDSGRSASVSAIRHFAEQAGAFHERYEQGLSPEDLRGNVDHLWQDGREADQQFRASSIPELRNDWAAIMQLLSRIRSAAGF